MTRKTSRRQRVRQATIEEIMTTARQQIAENGAANLSFGAIARAMGMTPPALYRYFKNRDALVMALVVDAYDSMAEAMEQADAAPPADDFPSRFFSIMRAYRRWALVHAEVYALMYNPPVSDPNLVLERIGNSMVRSLRVMVEMLWAAHESGCLTIPAPYREPPPTVQQALLWLGSTLGDEIPPPGILALSFIVWLRAHGLVWQELHGPLPAFLFSSGELYGMEARILAGQLGLAKL